MSRSGIAASKRKIASREENVVRVFFSNTHC